MPAQELPSRACAKCVWRVTVSTVQPQESYPEGGREGEDPHIKKCIFYSYVWFIDLNLPQSYNLTQTHHFLKVCTFAVPTPFSFFMNLSDIFSKVFTHVVYFDPQIGAAQPVWWSKYETNLISSNTLRCVLLLKSGCLLRELSATVFEVVVVDVQLLLLLLLVLLLLFLLLLLLLLSLLAAWPRDEAEPMRMKA